MILIVIWQESFRVVSNRNCLGVHKQITSYTDFRNVFLNSKNLLIIPLNENIIFMLSPKFVSEHLCMRNRPFNMPNSQE